MVKIDALCLLFWPRVSFYSLLFWPMLQLVLESWASHLRRRISSLASDRSQGKKKRYESLSTQVLHKACTIALYWWCGKLAILHNPKKESGRRCHGTKIVWRVVRFDWTQELLYGFSCLFVQRHWFDSNDQARVRVLYFNRCMLNTCLFSFMYSWFRPYMAMSRYYLHLFPPFCWRKKLCIWPYYWH